MNEYIFDKVLDPSVTQAGLFESCNIPSLIDRVVNGYHATIFAYGQTGSGKTHTMDGYCRQGRSADATHVFDAVSYSRTRSLPESSHAPYNTSSNEFASASRRTAAEATA